MVTLRLDAHGNGAHAWKGGQLETTKFANHTWVGKRYQKENDREGDFLGKLSPDYAEGEGTRWYVRISADHAPSEKGGTFNLNKKTSLRNLSDTPPCHEFFSSAAD